MMPFPDRFLILTCLVVGAVCNLQSSIALAEDPPAIASSPSRTIATWACDWTACTGTSSVHSDTERGYATADAASAAAHQKALEWTAAHCPGPPRLSFYGPYRESFVAPPGEESRVMEMQAAAPTAEWVVLYRCTSRNGGQIEVQMPGQTFCEAYSGARDIVCRYINDPAYGGACRCCYRVVKRPCCCHCVTRCR